MAFLTEGKVRSNIKEQRCNTTPKAPPLAPTPIPVKYQRVEVVKKKINHNKDLHTQVRLYNIMVVSILFGAVGILVASTFNFLGIAYIVSISINLGAIYSLPKFKSINIVHANNMKNDALVLGFILFFGPIMTIFVLTTLLLPPKKAKEKASNEAK